MGLLEHRCLSVEAQLQVNGRSAGVSWSCANGLDITAVVRPGTNTLLIEVPNHYATDAKTREQMTNESGLGGQQKPRPSGLLGPVEVRPYALINLEGR